MEQRLGQPSAAAAALPAAAAALPAAAPPLGDLVLKRSTNGGRSFEPLQVVYNSSAHGTGAAW